MMFHRTFFLVTASSWLSLTTGFVLPSSTPTRLSVHSMSETTTTSTPSSASSEKGPKELQGDFLSKFETAEHMLTKSIGQDMPMLLPPLLHFCKEYFSANQAAYADSESEFNAAGPTMERIVKGIELGMTFGLGNDKYTFGSSHKALRGKNPDEEGGNTYDYYKFGCDFFRPVMDIQGSVVNGKENLAKAVEQIEAGENVIFLANHQSEADPQVFSCLLETLGYNQLAESMVYVAGHKVTTDPLAIPFSMGRNLICIHSKKHIDSDPDTKPRKQKQNLQAMGSMLKSLKKGGCALWVAPSGGRDRRDLDTMTVPVAPFDSKTIDMFRLMGNKSKVKTHYYSLAMVSYELCPPPDFVEAGVGEQRNVRYSRVGISCGSELVSEGGLEKRHVFCEDAFNTCQAEYEQLLKDMHPDTQ